MVAIKTLKYNLLSIVKILIYRIFLNTYYKYEHINSSEIIIHHHLLIISKRSQMRMRLSKNGKKIYHQKMIGFPHLQNLIMKLEQQEL